MLSVGFWLTLKSRFCLECMFKNPKASVAFNIPVVIMTSALECSIKMKNILIYCVLIDLPP